MNSSSENAASSPSPRAQSNGFDQLHPLVQEFIWTQGWTQLRDVQEYAIAPVLRAATDVVIAAETAAGKTEAAFLPALSVLLNQGGEGLIVYVSPIKALINDQFSRLGFLCEKAEISVWPWHGDIGASVKSRFRARPKGVLLITPEALEAMLCTRGTQVAKTFEALTFFIVDELHAFIGSERGKQLQSLMHRIDTELQRKTPRIGLSATLGDMALACDFLRPGQTDTELVNADSQGGRLKLVVKGFVETAVDPIAVSDGTAQEVDGPEQGSAPVLGSAVSQISEHLYRATAGSNNLVFPNSRQQVEAYTVALNRLCERDARRSEYWPHHGSLSKELRTEAEAALKDQSRSATAVCTNTLELGIDIGAVKSVAQIGAPYSVASLRQRLGRSGRRPGEAKILRGYTVEVPQKSSLRLQDALRLETLQLVAMVRLLLQGWFEPPVQGHHYSTLVQQLLSLLSQTSGTSAAKAWALLCAPGSPFSDVSKERFVELLRQLGKLDLLVQDSGGVLLHGARGEKLVNHYSFYAAFKADEEFRLVTAGKTLGTLPVSNALKLGQKFLFGGKAWRIDDINLEQKVLLVTRSKGGAAPLYTSGRGRVHERVRQEMKALLESAGQVGFLDAQGQTFLQEARACYRSWGLSGLTVLETPGAAHVLTWSSDAVNATLAALLQFKGYSAWPGIAGVEVSLGEEGSEGLRDVLGQTMKEGLPSLDEMLADASNLEREKWDWALPRSMLIQSFASTHLDMNGLARWLRAATGEIANSGQG